MADDTQAHYARIGFTLLAGIALIVGTFAYFGKVGANKTALAAETFFHNPVTGLAPGADVCFRGVKVGTVKRLSFVGAEYPASQYRQAIWVALALDPTMFGPEEPGQTPADVLRVIVARGLHAKVSASLLTGLAHIELDFPTYAVKAAPSDWQPRTLSIPPQPTLLQSASDALPKLIAKVEQMDLAGSWSNVTQAAAAAQAFLGSAQALLDAQAGNLGEILTNVRDASAALRDLSGQLRDNPSLLLRAADPAPLAETAR